MPEIRRTGIVQAEGLAHAMAPWILLPQGGLTMASGFMR